MSCLASVAFVESGRYKERFVYWDSLVTNLHILEIEFGCSLFNTKKMWVKLLYVFGVVFVSILIHYLNYIEDLYILFDIVQYFWGRLSSLLCLLNFLKLSLFLSR